MDDAFALQNVNMERAAAAAYGGLVKRWRRWLIEQLTDGIFENCETSRNAVRVWQQRVFGQAVASSRLTRYANVKRSGGGRTEMIVVPPEVEVEIANFYSENRDKIKEI